MIGLLGAKIWKENGVDFGNPINLVPIAAGIVIGIGDVKVDITEDFSLEGISLGTIVAIAAYHLARAIAPEDLRDRADGPGGLGGTAITTGDHVYGDRTASTTSTRRATRASRSSANPNATARV